MARACCIYMKGKPLAITVMREESCRTKMQQLWTFPPFIRHHRKRSACHSKMFWTLFLFSVFALARLSSIKVLKLNSSIRPEDNVKVEIQDSSIDKLDQFSICGRFRTPQLPAMENKMQTLLYRSKLWFLNMLDMVSCEERYSGCTDYYKRAIGKTGKTKNI